MAKEIQDLKKYQVNTTMMGANKNEIDQLVSKVGEQQHLYTEAMKQLKEWTRNAFARECYSVWAHQQANPNLIEMPVDASSLRVLGERRPFESIGKQNRAETPRICVEEHAYACYIKSSPRLSNSVTPRRGNQAHPQHA
ncbi:hypothetical protein PIB30_106321 [Stylosanthes scabra]|uniref:Uncharacterized protein n=1 Tax=Stylosanthes scabra TaxID=79078 RepID=A0ABU6XXW8_9FABA|nr:hypothetical protein [Stylosanthes scabra]